MSGAATQLSRVSLLDDRNRAWTWSLLLFLAAWTFLSSPWLFGSVTIPWDAKAHFYPQLQFLAQSLHRGDEPFWTPFVFSGSPQIADPQSLIFSPFFLALAAIDPNPGFQAFDAIVLGSLGVGGAFLMLYCRDRGWHPAGGLVAGIVFAFGASAAWRLQHVGQILSFAVWPIALWTLMRALSRSSILYGFSAGAIAGIMALGRDQVAYLGLLLLAFAVIASWLQSAARFLAVRDSILPLSAGALGGLLVVTIPVLLTYFLAENSNRPVIVYGEAARGAMHPALLLTSLIPNLFGVDGPFLSYWGPPSPRWGASDYVLARNMGVIYCGSIPFVLLAGGFLRGTLWKREIRPVAIGLVFMLLYALGSVTPVFSLAFHSLPGVDLFRRPADALFYVGALSALCCGYLVHRFFADETRQAWGVREIGLILVAFAVAIALAFAKSAWDVAAPALAISALFLSAALALLARLPSAARAYPTLAMAALGVFMVADLRFNNGPNESTALPPAMFDVLDPESGNELLAILKKRLAPESYDRVELTGLGFHWPNASLVHRLHHILGYNPIRLHDYSAATGAEDHVALPDQRRFSPLFFSYRSPLADLLGLRFIATGIPVEEIDPALKPGDLSFVARTQDGYLYENQRALPRILFATQSLVVDPKRLLVEGNLPNFDPRSTVLLPAEAPPLKGSAGEKAAQVKIEDYRNTQILVDVDTAQPGYLVLNDPFQSWWTAQLDGAEIPIYQANVIFRAVAVPEGKHKIRFVFQPLRGLWRELSARLFR